MTDKEGLLLERETLERIILTSHLVGDQISRRQVAYHEIAFSSFHVQEISVLVWHV